MALAPTYDKILIRNLLTDTGSQLASLKQKCECKITAIQNALNYSQNYYQDYENFICLIQQLREDLERSSCPNTMDKGKLTNFIGDIQKFSKEILDHHIQYENLCRQGNELKDRTSNAAEKEELTTKLGALRKEWLNLFDKYTNLELGTDQILRTSIEFQTILSQLIHWLQAEKSELEEGFVENGTLRSEFLTVLHSCMM